MYNKQVKHRAIQVRIPRTGTGSMGEMLGTVDGHKTAKDLKKQLGSIWNEIFKFAIVRHPYTRFSSCYIALGFDKQYGDVNDFLKNKRIREAEFKKQSTFLRPQCDYILDDDGKVMVDYIGRFEKLKEEWIYIFKKLNYYPQFAHKNKTERKHHELNEASRGLLFHIYRKDFEKFDYKR